MTLFLAARRGWVQRIVWKKCFVSGGAGLLRRNMKKQRWTQCIK